MSFVHENITNIVNLLDEAHWGFQEAIRVLTPHLELELFHDFIEVPFELFEHIESIFSSLFVVRFLVFNQIFTLLNVSITVFDNLTDVSIDLHTIGTVQLKVG
jgi:hypothetical protein